MNARKHKRRLMRAAMDHRLLHLACRLHIVEKLLSISPRPTIDWCTVTAAYGPFVPMPATRGGVK